MRAASSASSFDPKKNPASTVTTIKNGNRAMRVDNAMWLAIAQPSSSLNCRNASAASRIDRLRTRNGCSRRRHPFKSSIDGRFSSLLPAFSHPFGIDELSRLYVVEELTDLGLKALGFDCDQIGKVPNVRCRRPGAGGHFSHAGHRLRPDASLVRCPADAFRNRCDGRTLLVNGRSCGCGNCGHFPDDGRRLARWPATRQLRQTGLNRSAGRFPQLLSRFERREISLPPRRRQILCRFLPLVPLRWWHSARAGWFGPRWRG